MRVSLEFPVVEEIVGSEVTIWAMAEDQFEIPEYGEAELPVLLKFGRVEKRPDEIFRYLPQTGDLYRRLATVALVVKASPQHDWVAPGRHVPEEMTRDLAVSPAQIKPESTIYMPAQNRLQGRDGKSSPAYSKSQAAMRGIVSRLGVVGKWVHVPADEPVVCLYRTSFGWKYALQTNPVYHAGGERRMFHFSVSQFDEAEEFRRQLAAELGGDMPDYELDIAQGYQPKWDGYALDVELACRDACFRLSAAADTLAQRRYDRWDGGGMDALPMPMLESYVALRRYLSLAPEDRVEDATENALDVLEELPVMAKAEGMPKAAARAVDNAWHIRKWRDRPVSILPTVGFSI